MTSDPRPEVALPLHGGCACGAVRYTIASAPILLFACHCTGCQKQSGSAFGQSLRVLRADLAITGATETRVKQTERGALSETVFCPACGTRLLNARPNTPHAHLKAGTLDDTSWLRPAAHLWLSRRQPWVVADAETLSYDEQPDSLEAIAQLWQARMAPTFV